MSGNGTKRHRGRKRARTGDKGATGAIRPVETLREQATALEAALVRVLASPEKKVVHVLRTSTRRLEAQLELLRILPEIPEHARERRRLSKRLRRVRRASGAVRDLDVLADILSDRDKHPELWGAETPEPILQQAKRLAAKLERRRETEANKLVREVNRHRGDLPGVMESLLQSLKTQDEQTLTEEELVSLAHRWFAGRMLEDRGDTNDDALHDLRKGAKLVRYLLETAPGEAGPAHRAAAEFEAVQEAGGRWHDLLTLEEEAADLLGKRSRLAQLVRELRDRTRGEYLRSLYRFGLRI